MKASSFLPVNLLLLLTLLLFASQLPIVLNIWQFSFDDGTYSHAYLIPFISAFLYWELHKKHALILRERFSPLTLLPVIAIGFLLVIFTFAQFTVGYRVFIVLFYCALISLLFNTTIKTLFPAFFLIFLVPIWGILINPLQQLSTLAVTNIMELTNIPTFVEGNTISIPEGVFEIAGGCSGLRYLIVSLAISSMFIFLHINKLKHALLFLTLATVGALLTNWLRITALILIGHYTNMESELMTDHNMFGWYLYIPYMLALFAFGQRFCTNTEPANEQAIATATPNYLTITIALLAILISSPFILNNLMPKDESLTAQNCQQIDINNYPEPVLIQPHHRCAIKKAQTLSYLYTFTGEELGSSVDYYLHKFVPENYKVEQETQDENWQKLIVANSKARYQISYQFVSGELTTTKISTFKKLKIKNAFQGIRSSQLLWVVTPL